MIIYEVNIRVVETVAEEYEEWLNGHVRTILELEGFRSAEWFIVEQDKETQDLEEAVRQAVRLDESVPTEIREAAASSIPTRMYCIQYRLRDRESLTAYLDGHAEAMRQDGIERFGAQFAATRRIMSLYKKFTKTRDVPRN
jgi:hypothetical protein